MPAYLLISFIGSLVGLPFSAARSLEIASLDIGLIRAANTGLIARQATGNVPAQCKSMCDPVNSQIASKGCTAQRCCTSTFETQYFNCAMCVGNAVGITDYTAPQAFLNCSVQATMCQCGRSGPRAGVSWTRHCWNRGADELANFCSAQLDETNIHNRFGSRNAYPSGPLSDGPRLAADHHHFVNDCRVRADEWGLACYQ